MAATRCEMRGNSRQPGGDAWKFWILIERRTEIAESDLHGLRGALGQLHRTVGLCVGGDSVRLCIAIQT